MMGYLEDNHNALVDKTTGGVIVLARRTTWSSAAAARTGSRSSGSAAVPATSAASAPSCARAGCWAIRSSRTAAMRSLGFNLVGEANVIGTSFCCECNLCSLYSCPEDLDPKNVCTQNKRRLAAEKRAGRTRRSIPGGPDCTWTTARPPCRRLMQKLGLTAVPQRRAAPRPAAARAAGGHQVEAAPRSSLRADWSRPAIAWPKARWSAARR